MIKLIITDVDDTLVPEGSRNLNPEYFDMIRKFQEKGIIFIVASGRQKPSIKKTFAPMQDELIYLADNGTDIYAPDFQTSSAFREEDYQGLIKDLKELEDGYAIMSCKPDCSYIEKKEDAYYHRMVDRYGYIVESVDDVADLEGICKLSLFNPNGIDSEVEQKMKERWGGVMDVTLAGDLFLDFMGKGCNKGNGLRILQEHYGVTPAETVAFGNADNDVPMLLRAKYAYAVGNGSEKIKFVATEVIGEMKEDAVLAKMKEIYETL